jgi:hypothetical protein
MAKKMEKYFFDIPVYRISEDRYYEYRGNYIEKKCLLAHYIK